MATDWGDLMGLVVIGGVTVKMAERLFPEKKQQVRRKKKNKCGLTSSKQFYNSPF